MRRAIELLVLLVVGAALYPFISIGGWLDQAFGIWWAVTIGAGCFAFLVFAGLTELRRKALTKRRVAQIWVEADDARMAIAKYERRARYRPATLP